MRILKNLFIGNLPPGLTNEILDAYIRTFAFEVCRDQFEEYFGLLILYQTIVPHYIEKFDDFRSEINYFLISSEQNYNKLKNQLIKFGSKVRDVRVPLWDTLDTVEPVLEPVFN